MEEARPRGQRVSRPGEGQQCLVDLSRRGRFRCEIDDKVPDRPPMHGVLQQLKHFTASAQMGYQLGASPLLT